MNTTTPQHLDLVKFYESNTGRWYVTQGRTWKVRLNNDNEATAIHKNRGVYRLVGDTTYDSNTSRAIRPDTTIHRDVVALVANARRVELR